MFEVALDIMYVLLLVAATAHKDSSQAVNVVNIALMAALSTWRLIMELCEIRQYVRGFWSLVEYFMTNGFFDWLRFVLVVLALSDLADWDNTPAERARCSIAHMFCMPVSIASVLHGCCRLQNACILHACRMLQTLHAICCMYGAGWDCLFCLSGSVSSTLSPHLSFLDHACCQSNGHYSTQAHSCS